MKKFLIFIGVGVVIIIGLVFVLQFVQKQNTKSFSPEDKTSFKDGNVVIDVSYNRPLKKDREIFGKLVPYDQVWRTGANEATIFETNTDLNIEGKVLKAGKYSLWTIPGKEVWTVIFNSEHGQWGINSDGEANRKAVNDVLTVQIASVQSDQTFEQFTISFEGSAGDGEMILLWDKTVVPVPFSYK